MYVYKMIINIISWQNILHIYTEFLKSCHFTISLVSVDQFYKFSPFQSETISAYTGIRSIISPALHGIVLWKIVFLHLFYCNDEDVTRYVIFGEFLYSVNHVYAMTSTWCHVKAFGVIQQSSASTCTLRLSNCTAAWREDQILFHYL